MECNNSRSRPKINLVISNKYLCVIGLTIYYRLQNKCLLHAIFVHDVYDYCSPFPSHLTPQFIARRSLSIRLFNLIGILLFIFLSRIRRKSAVEFYYLE